MFSRLNHNAACVRTSLFFKAKQPSIVGIYYIPFIHLLVYEHLGSFKISKAYINIA